MSDSGFYVVIPARFASTRFPGKALAELGGKPMIQHVYERARGSRAGEVIVATDDERIAAVATAFGADVVMTAVDCATGTDRVAAVAAQRGWPADSIVVNVQGDVPLIPSASIDQVADLLADHVSADLATLSTPITSSHEYNDTHVVKVVFDQAGRALYFSRAAIPARADHSEIGADAKQEPGAWRHIGLYAYRVGALARLTSLAPCALEQRERLEQLRALWHGMKIQVGVMTESHGPDVDTPDDLVAAERYLTRNG